MQKNASLKDAVMLFGTGCTGEFISNQGLFLLLFLFQE
jgi:hypothetical protein